MNHYPNRDAVIRATQRGEVLPGQATLDDGRKHYGVMRAHVHGETPERVVVNLIGTARDTLADALREADHLTLTRTREVRRLGMYFYAVRLV